MNLVKLNDNHEPVVSGRTLHRELGVNSNYTTWFDRMTEYGFTEGVDYHVCLPNSESKHGRGGHNKVDHVLKLDMAKEIAMIQRTEKGKEVRQYFIQVERDYNSPEKIMARALNIANTRLSILETTVEKMKPKALFADAVAASKTSILVGELAKILRQNHVEIGQNRLYEYLRSNGYLHRGGSSRNLPTQRSMEMGLFEIKETTHTNPDGTVLITKTTKVTGKGQQYFINKFLA
ncbi:phage antirepressor KilAC domain-containing protein [Abiotrophia defectiva]|uniref:phage antirepressor KilAC domain-containing protein n=1 Tax=Abiotrophia defectiva TaxID=46125 RepID=UPI0026F14276|nr:phage antirepressor KilAC domain-containing protein [Abiotrophia defectiva]